MKTPKKSAAGARAAGGRSRAGTSFEDMAARRAERLVNLVICLLSTRQFITAEQIRHAVPGYEAPEQSDEAFKRSFERDKAELRDLGVPLEVGRNSIFETEDGYRVRRDDYELPPLEFDPAEAAAVGLAARLWQSATLGGPARSALVKLRAGGSAVEFTQAVGASPHIDSSDPALPVLLEAAQTARAVRFDYQKSGDAQPLRRRIQPWGVLSWHARWYLVGHDLERGEPRSFRLSRIVGTAKFEGAAGAFTRPSGINLLDFVNTHPRDLARIARIRVGESGADGLRRMAQSEHDGVLEIEYFETDRMARLVAGAGAGAGSGALALSPPELVDAVRQRLAAAAGLTSQASA